MAYNNNVPLGNQTIASTTDPIRNNFAFLQDAIGQEHNFDATDATKTYHLQASMPNQADPVALPMDTDGIYYISGGKPKFYDGTTASFIQTGSTSQIVVTGTVALTTSSTTIVTLPMWSQGYFLLSPSSTSGLTVGNRRSSGFWVSSDISISANFNTGSNLTIVNSGLDLNGATVFGTSNGDYKFTLVYFTP